MKLVRTVAVPGCYETPFIADWLLRNSGLCGVIILGYIERGETLHGEVMGQVVHRALVELEIKYQIPIGLGIIGPGATVEQARLRTSGSATGAVRAVVVCDGLMKTAISFT